MNDEIQMTNVQSSDVGMTLFRHSSFEFRHFAVVLMLSGIVATSLSAADEIAPTPIPMVAPVTVRSSLYKQAMAIPAPPPAGASEPVMPPTAAAQMSMYAVPTADAKRFKKHDLITIIVSEISDTTVSSKNNNKKEQTFNTELKDFLDLSIAKGGWPSVGKMKNTNMPKIGFDYSDDRKATADQTRSDKMTLRITAEVIDVKPNGTLRIEATKRIRNDKEEQVMKLSGLCRIEDIQADNTLLSTQLADMVLSKDTAGEVRDGTKRGWLNRFIDKVNPF